MNGEGREFGPFILCSNRPQRRAGRDVLGRLRDTVWDIRETGALGRQKCEKPLQYRHSRYWPREGRADIKDTLGRSGQTDVGRDEPQSALRKYPSYS